jgi:hypothetical protein
MSAINITNIPPSTEPSTPITSLPKYFKERRAEVQQLQEALKSGDLAAAQQDYNNIVALGNNVLHRDNPFIRSDRGLDFDAIGGALQSGDLAGARQAFAALENTYKIHLDGTPSNSTATTAAGLESQINVIA